MYTFSGLAFCGDCGAPMTRKVSTVGGKKYAYYMCSNHKINKSCTSHRIREDILENRVVEALRDFITELVAAEEIINNTDNSVSDRIDIRKMQERITANSKTIDKITSDLADLYSDYKGGMFSSKEFLNIKKEFETRKAAAEKAVEMITAEIEKARQGDNDNSAVIEEFKQYGNISKLTRSTAVRLIRKVKVYEGNLLELELDCEDQLYSVLEKAETIKQEKVAAKEAV